MKPCQCGASKSLQGCPPCLKARAREHDKRRYYREKAERGPVKLGRPRKESQEKPKPQMDCVNPTTADFLRRPLRVMA